MARWQGAVLILIAIAFGASPAEAGLRLCNRTDYILYAATGTAIAGEVTTAGWTRIVPGGCASAIVGALGANAYYVYARSAQAHDGPARAWGGDTRLCTRDTDFTLQQSLGIDRCPGDNAFQMPFGKIDTGGKTNWTTTFTQSPPYPSADAARHGGLIRLLGDNGYRLTADTKAQFDHAIEKFRVRMNMPKDASDTDLFDALETEAMKVAAPAGYSVCNDTDETLWAALGLREARSWRSRGWWQISAGACAHMLTTPLQAKRIYLLVERGDGQRLVAGKASFCITNIAFDIEKRTGCKERGLTAAGFAATDTQGRSGYSAHIGEDGLLPPLRPRPRSD